MKAPYLLEILFVISIMVFLLAVILIIPTAWKERKMRKNETKKKKWNISMQRRMRSLKKTWQKLFKIGVGPAMLLLAGKL